MATGKGRDKMVSITLKNIRTDHIIAAIILYHLNDEVLQSIEDATSDIQTKCLSKGTLLHIIHCYRKIVLDQYKKLYYAIPFKSSAQSYFVNKMIVLNQFFYNLYLNNEEKLCIMQDEFQSIEVELYSLINLFNIYDPKKAELNMELI